MKKLLKILCRIIIFLLGIIILFVSADILLRAFSPSDELTVSARFRIPVEKSDRDYNYYMHQRNGFKTVLVSPADKIEIAEGAHDAPYRPAKMKNGVIRKGFEYGPDAIQGIIRKEDILKVWPETTLDGDWPFVVYFYNTSTGRALRMYLDIFYDTESDKAKAVFYVYYQGNAKPATDTWEGKLGDKVLVELEL